jgi:integrase
MASIFKIPRSPFWFAAYRGARGERVQRTTKQRKRSHALEIARQWERLAAKGRARTLTEAQARHVVSEILESTTGETLQFHTCRAWFDEWLAGKRGVVAAKSIEKYEQVKNDFLVHLGERAELTLAAIGPKDVRSFRDALAAGGRTPATVNQTIRKVLSAPFLAAVRLGYIPTNPCVAVEPLRDDADATRDTFTVEQVGKLMEAAEGEWKGAILAGYFTGLRLRDVAELCWSAVDFEAGVLRIKTRKTGAMLVLPLHDQFAVWLRKQPRGIGQAPIFPTLTGKGTGGRHGLSGLFKTIMEKAKIKGRLTRGADGKGRKTTSLSFHSLRHSFVSALANAGVAAELRQKLSGHADDQTHARYTHHEIETLRAAVAKLPRVGSAG